MHRPYREPIQYAGAHPASQGSIGSDVTMPFETVLTRDAPGIGANSPNLRLLREGLGHESCLALSPLPDADAMCVSNNHQLPGLGLVV